MQELCIHFQHNVHCRDLIYELSTTYLIARTIHLAARLRLADELSMQGVSRKTIISRYVNYHDNAVSLLIDYLIAYRVVETKQDDLLYATPLSQALCESSEMFAISENEWCESYDILHYLNQHTFAIEPIEIDIQNNSLTLRSASSKALIDELAHLHLLSRAIRYATQVGIFELHTNNGHAISLNETYHKYLPILRLLTRYQLLTYDETQNTIRFNSRSAFLMKSNKESLYFAMHMIDNRWWKAVAHIEESFKKSTVSAFEFANNMSFYQAYSDDRHCFAHGMAAISLYEDEEVAQAGAIFLQPYLHIIDIGGGEGGLLMQLHQCFGDSKNLILFEKANAQNGQLTTNNTKVNVVLGDFLQSCEINNIPKVSHAAYIIKCVIHNMQKNDAITLLRNVRLAMREDCQLFIAERIVDENNCRPQPNLACNLLMRVLFKAEVHNISFYQEIINSAGFTINNITNAGNYRIFAATEKPELKFQKIQKACFQIKQPLQETKDHITQDTQKYCFYPASL